MIWRPVLLGGLARVRLVEGDPAGSARHLMSAPSSRSASAMPSTRARLPWRWPDALTALGQFEAAARTLGTPAHPASGGDRRWSPTSTPTPSPAGFARRWGNRLETQFAAGERLTAAVAAEQLRVVLSPELVVLEQASADDHLRISAVPRRSAASGPAVEPLDLIPLE